MTTTTVHRPENTTYRVGKQPRPGERIVAPRTQELLVVIFTEERGRIVHTTDSFFSIVERAAHGHWTIYPTAGRCESCGRDLNGERAQMVHSVYSRGDWSIFHTDPLCYARIPHLLPLLVDDGPVDPTPAQIGH